MIVGHHQDLIVCGDISGLLCTIKRGFLMLLLLREEIFQDILAAHFFNKTLSKDIGYLDHQTMQIKAKISISELI